ncbi:MAG: transcription antitermination factor NusB [Chlorobi bacterium]|nr:transcription antitermination factor NusB [Chlorobiota bacterium]
MIVKKSQRRIARERALQILYAYEFNRDNLTLLIEGITADLHGANDKEFSAKLANLVIGHRNELDDFIKGKVDNWEIERIALIDRILLRMGIAELLFFEDIPPKVSINEVIEMAKEYSTSNSGKFLNGILDAILSDLKSSGKIKKTGRGLLEKSLKK